MEAETEKIIGNIVIEGNATMMGIKGNIISDKNKKSIGEGNQRKL